MVLLPVLLALPDAMLAAPPVLVALVVLNVLVLVVLAGWPLPQALAVPVVLPL